MISRGIRLRLGVIVFAVAALATVSSAQAVTYLQLGSSNASNATTTLTGTTAGPELLVKNANGSSPSAFSLYGLLTATSPTVNAAAVRGYNSATNAFGYGVWGSQAGSGTGVYGSSPSGKGVWGTTTSGTGVRGQSTSGVGVLGQHLATTGTAPGVSASTNSTAADAAALVATVTPTSPGLNSEAVRGVNNGTGANGIGVYGQQNGSGYGVYGYSPSGRGVYGASPFVYGVYGQTSSGTGVVGVSSSGTGVFGYSGTSWAGYFQGDVNVSGTLTKGGGAFRIDHPLHPAHTYLQHSFVESPDMMDVYNGNVRTNRRGFATVRLPKYFQALNRSFRYQLTSLSGLQEVAVAKEITHNRFTIQSQKPHSRISWQVTGVRHDRFANAHRIQVVLPKPKAEQGRYLHPELYGQPKSQAIGYLRPPAITGRSVPTP